MGGIYLDNAASTRVKKGVLAEFVMVAEQCIGNPSSEHKEGILAENIIKTTKNNIASKLHCDSDDIFFTSGATMSNQLLIQGFVAKHPNAMIITTSVEHNDILMCVNNLLVFRHILDVDKNGLIDVDKLSAVLEYSADIMSVPTLVCIQMANSETGIVQPIQRIASVVKKYDNAFLHMDATQYIPYYPINMECWGIDSISMSGQKIGGIKGSGLFVARQTLRNHIKPIIYGEQGLIGGTPSTPLIASLGVAIDEINYHHTLNIAKRRNALWGELQNLGAVLVGGTNNRLPNNIYCRFPGVDGLTLLHLLDENEIYIGTGSACSTGSDKPSHVAIAYGLSEKEAFECVRFTLSDDTTYGDIEKVANVIKGILPLIKE